MTRTTLLAAALALVWWFVVVSVALCAGATFMLAVTIALVLGPLGGAVIEWHVGSRA
jgi:hypothetical protein